jgi:hypothetical protein
MDIRSNQSMINNDPRPANPQVSSQIKKGLSGDVIITIGRDYFQATTSVSAIKKTYTQMKDVNDRCEGISINSNAQLIRFFIR